MPRNLIAVGFAALALASAAAVATPAFADAMLSEDAPSRLITVPKDKSLSFRLDEPATKIVVSQPDIAEVIATTDRSFYVRGIDTGATNLLVYGPGGRLLQVIDVLLNYQRLDALGFNAEVLFRPALRGVWRDPKSMAAASRLGFIRYWRSTGNWPDFCSDPTLPYDCKEVAAKYP